MPQRPIPHVGFDKLPSVLAEIESGISGRLHIGAQTYVSVDGEIIANAAIGWATAGVEMRTDSVNHWLSAGKPITSVAIALLRERGRLDIDTPVAHFIPEFGANGKHDITPRHILTHTAGILDAESADRLGSREEIVAAICDTAIADDWRPGERAAYQPTAGWHVLGELVFRFTGQSIEQFTLSEILEPLGMTDAALAWTAEGDTAMPLPQRERFRERENPDPSTTPDLVPHNRWAPMHRVTPDGELEPHPAYSVDAMGAFARPGSSFRASATGFARLYEMLLNGGKLAGVRILSEESAHDMTRRHREGLADETFGMKLDWGLGVIPNNRRYGDAVPYGYGPHASDSSFGHGGSMSSTGFVDPEHSLVVTLIFNGMPGHPKHDRRLKRTLAALYEDLGLG